MKIYLAGSCGTDRRTQMRKIATALRRLDYEVYCPFELKIENAWDMPQEEWAQKVFDADVAAIDACDLVVMISPGRVSTAGTNWEQGYAYAKGKRILVFQYTREPASLMTYCGCENMFIMAYEFDNTTDEIANNIAKIVELYDEPDPRVKKFSVNAITLT